MNLVNIPQCSWKALCLFNGTQFTWEQRAACTVFICIHTVSYVKFTFETLYFCLHFYFVLFWKEKRTWEAKKSQTQKFFKSSWTNFGNIERLCTHLTPASLKWNDQKDWHGLSNKTFGHKIHFMKMHSLDRSWLHFLPIIQGFS